MHRNKLQREKEGFLCLPSPDMKRKHRSSISHSDFPFIQDPLNNLQGLVILRLRYYLHPVLLSLPDVVPEEQVLQFLQDIQLGLRHDVYPVVFCQTNLHVEPAGVIRRASGPLGNHILPASRTVLRGNKRLSEVPELHGKAVRP